MTIPFGGLESNSKSKKAIGKTKRDRLRYFWDKRTLYNLLVNFLLDRMHLQKNLSEKYAVQRSKSYEKSYQKGRNHYYRKEPKNKENTTSSGRKNLITGL